MHADDFSTFDRAFRRVCGAFRLKLKVEEASELTQTYFRLLESHSLDDVLDSGRTLLASAKRFPLAAEWLSVLETTARAKHRETATVDRRQMTQSEIDEWEDADRLRFEGQPCLCADCVRANIDEQPIRFVPTVRDADGYELAFNPRRKVVQIAGHWAHGDELARWYAARENFFLSVRRSPRVARLLPALVGV
jgi:hypothetical protein